MEERTSQSLKTEHDELLFGTWRSVRYHRHRERFLDCVHHLGSLLTTFAGAATVTTSVAQLPAEWAWLLPTAAAITAVAGAHEVMFKTAERARQHELLARDFVALEQNLVRVQWDLTTKALLELQNRRLHIEATEPPTYRVLDAMCHDELVTALGRDPGQRTNVTFWQRRCGHFFDLAPHRIRKGHDRRMP